MVVITQIHSQNECNPSGDFELSTSGSVSGDGASPTGDTNLPLNQLTPKPVATDIMDSISSDIKTVSEDEPLGNCIEKALQVIINNIDETIIKLQKEM